MTKKNLKPQQAIPIQREINTTFFNSTELTAQTHDEHGKLTSYSIHPGNSYRYPFAGDDAE